MSTSFDFYLYKHSRKIKIFILIVIGGYLFWELIPIINKNDYNILLVADTLNVYNEDGELIVRTDNPKKLFGDSLIDGGVVVGKPGIDKLPRRRNMAKLYTLEFVEAGKVISNIDVLIPKTEKAIEQFNEVSIRGWLETDNQYVILSKNRQYFSLGKIFLENLSELIKES